MLKLLGILSEQTILYRYDLCNSSWPMMYLEEQKQTPPPLFFSFYEVVLTIGFVGDMATGDTIS